MKDKKEQKAKSHTVPPSASKKTIFGAKIKEWTKVNQVNFDYMSLVSKELMFYM